MLKYEFEKNIDIILAISGIVLGLVVVSLYILSPTIYLISIGLALLLGCSTYIAIRKKSFSKCQYKVSFKEKRFLSIMYFILFSASLISWHISVNRPISYFLLFSFCSGILALSIYLSDNKKDYFFQYIKIILLSFNIKYSIYMSAGFIPGVDSYVHIKIIELITKAGSIDIITGKELYFPIMHIQTAITKMMLALSLKDASNFAVIIPFILITTFIYLIAKSIFGEQIGLISMLLVNISDYHIYWGSAPQTTSYGIIFYYLLMYILIKRFHSAFNAEWTLLFIFLTIMLIITHAVSSFIFMVTMFSLFFGSVVYNHLYINKLKVYHGGLFLISVISLLQYWFIAMLSKGSEPFFDKIISTLHYYITGYADFLNRPEATLEIASALPPFIERFADTFGLSVYLFFAIIGSLMSLSYRRIDQIKFNYILILIILFGITFAFPLFGIRNILPTRWFAFEYLFVSVFASYAIVQIFRLTNRITLMKLFFIFIFCVLAFFMPANTISNLDSPLWLKDSTISTTYNPAEIRGAETLSMHSNHIFSDSRYGSSVISVYLGINNMNFYGINQINERSNELFLWRNYMLTNPVRVFGKFDGNRRVVYTEILGTDTLKKLNSMNRIYDNAEIIGFYII